MAEEDDILISRYLGGDQASLKVLIDKYTSVIYSFTLRFVGATNAPDITQEVFIKVWRNLKSFNREKSQFKTWLFTIARNTVTDYQRKKKSINFSQLGDDFKEDELEDDSILADEVYDKLQDKEMLSKVLEELPYLYRMVLTLHYQEDMTFKEIGEVLSKPQNTVKSYHHRALILLRENIIQTT